MLLALCSACSFHHCPSCFADGTFCMTGPILRFALPFLHFNPRYCREIAPSSENWACPGRRRAHCRSRLALRAWELPALPSEPSPFRPRFYPESEHLWTQDPRFKSRLAA